MKTARNWYGLRCRLHWCPCKTNREGWCCVDCGEQKGFWTSVEIILTNGQVVSMNASTFRRILHAAEASVVMRPLQEGDTEALHTIRQLQAIDETLR